MLRVTRGQLEFYVRHLEQYGYAPATVARRFGTVATFYRYAVIERGDLGQPGGGGDPPEGRLGGSEAHRVAPAGVRRACRRPPAAPDLTTTLWCVCSGCSGCGCQKACAGDIRYESGYELLRMLGKGASPPTSRCPSPSCAPSTRRSRGARPDRSLRSRTGRRMDRAAASRALSRVTRAAGITRPISPHGLRRTFCTTGLVAGIGIRDMQYAMRHADPRTTRATTWPRPTSTATPPTPSPPTSPA
jgi:integrase/recombinase XerD